MDFKVNREILGTSEVVFDGLQEQSVELDYILPDYFPDIFKLIKCQLDPRIVSSNVSGDKLTYELVVGIKILYCAEQSCAVQCIEQKMNYSKTVDLGRIAENPVVMLKPKVDYANCRVVNQRRIDLRGAISTKIKVVCEQKQQVICDAYGMNVQLKKTPVSYSGNKLTASKRITVSEEFDLGYSKPNVIGIIRSEAIVMSSDKKVITNKLIVKGEAQINCLYSCKKDNTDSLEAMQFTLPYSQIMDIEGIDERYECLIDVSAASCEIITRENSDGENKILECELILLINCTAIKNSNVDLVTDAYSTTYPCDYSISNAKIEKCPKQIIENFITKTSLEYKDGEINCVYDAWSKVQNINTRVNPDKKQIEIMGNVSYSVMARSDLGTPIILENEVPFEYCINMEKLSDEHTFDARVLVISCSYNLASTNTVEVKSEIRICGNLYETVNCRVLSDITFDEAKTKPKNGDYALKLYFANKGEEIWNIAKRYSTSVEAIMEENDLEEETLSQHGMILIPIIY